MLERRSGVILHISSIQHRLPLYDRRWRTLRRKQRSAPTAKVWRRSRSEGSAVNLISPGFIETSGAHG